jgi:hypothetical protein
LVFSESSIPRWLPRTPDSQVWNEFFVATEGSAVRGAYALKHEQVYVRGKGVHKVACYHHSLSEGIVDRSYTSVGVLLARDALVREPLLYALGMGGADRPIALMLKALGFTLTELPFYFRVLCPRTFLSEIEVLRQGRGRALVMALAAMTGAGWLAITGAQTLSSLRSRPGSFVAEEVEEFSSWADDLWNDAKDSVSMAAVRDAKTLRIFYPSSDRGLTRVRVSRSGKAIGWAVVGERRKDRKFGEMRVGSVVDCWAFPEDRGAIVRAAAQALESRGVDLIVTNQAHHLWCRAFETSGFLRGPSTFVLALSKKLTQLLQPLQKDQPLLHITRADGDGLPRNF